MRGSALSFKKLSKFFGEEPPRVEDMETFLEGLGYSHLYPVRAHMVITYLIRAHMVTHKSPYDNYLIRAHVVTHNTIIYGNYLIKAHIVT